MKKIIYTTLAVIILVSPAFAAAAEISAVSEKKSFVAGEKFQVELLLDTEGESLNAFGGSIDFPKDLLELSEIRDGNSIVNFWIEKPKVNSFSFSGITPGGYVGGHGLVVSLIFTSLKNGSGAISVSGAEVLRNDGKGTPVKVSAKRFLFVVADSGGKAPDFLDAVDADQPESFVPAIARDPNIFDGKWFAVFASSDKGSGIDHYEVAEKKHGIFFDSAPSSAEWIAAESPYLLSDQSRRSELYFRAIDNNGNIRVAVIHTAPALRYILFALLGILMLTVLIRKYHPAPHRASGHPS